MCHEVKVRKHGNKYHEYLGIKKPYCPECMAKDVNLDHTYSEYKTTWLGMFSGHTGNAVLVFQCNRCGCEFTIKWKEKKYEGQNWE